jgi:hypothetical protein
LEILGEALAHKNLKNIIGHLWKAYHIF